MGTAINQANFLNRAMTFRWRSVLGGLAALALLAAPNLVSAVHTPAGPPAAGDHQFAPINVNADEFGPPDLPPGLYPGFPDGNFSDEVPLPNPLRFEPLAMFPPAIPPDPFREKDPDENENLTGADPFFDPGHPTHRWAFGSRRHQNSTAGR